MKARHLLHRWDIEPSKGLGQNFLVDPVILGKIVAAAGLTPDDVVLEIGPGLGTLTEQLADQAGRVIAVELDKRLITPLEGVLSGHENVTIVQGDILALDLAELMGPEPYKVVANLPYYITSAVLRHLLEPRHRPSQIIVTVQREVADRITAQPGDMSLLAVSVQFYGEPERLFRIKSGSFYPSPQVDSAVLRIDVHDAPPLPEQAIDDFFRVVKAGFAQRRKQVHNPLADGLHLSREETVAALEAAGIDHRRRPQTLSVAEWIALAHALGIID